MTKLVMICVVFCKNLYLDLELTIRFMLVLQDEDKSII